MVLVQSEPNGLLMMRYKLYFNQQSPDPEDPWVLAYLEQHGLEPRRQLDEEIDGLPFKVLHFGQCYLGRHVGALGELYQRGVEHTVLAQHIQQVLEASDTTAVQATVRRLTPQEVQALALALAAQLHDTARFEVSQEHELHVSLDAAAVMQAFLNSQPSAMPER